MTDTNNYKKIDETLEFVNGKLKARVTLNHETSELVIHVYDKENAQILDIFPASGDGMGQFMEYVGLLGMVSNWYYNL